MRPDIIRDGFSNGSGQYSTGLPIVANTALLGHRIYLQLFCGDLAANPWGRTASNGLELLIGN